MSSDTAPPFRTNALLTAVTLAVAWLQLVAVPLVLLPQAPLWAGIVLLVLGLMTPFNTAVLHEAIHGRLASNARWNDRIGRALALCSGTAFDVIRFGHLSHHRYNRHALDRPDVIEPGRSRLRAFLEYYAHLRGGLYLVEVLATIAMLLPRKLIDRLIGQAMAANEPAIAAIRRAARRGIDRRIQRIRIDALLAILITTGAFYLYGAWWPLLLMAVALRGLIVSLQDNLPHYGTPPVIGAPAHNTRAPRWAALLMLNQNLHAVHHDRPDLPWHALPAALGPSGRYTDRYVLLMLKQFLGPRRPGTAG
jgi:fatty acid desaturase